MSMRLNREERRQIEEVARLWGCRGSEVLRFCFRMVLLGKKAEMAETDLPAGGVDQVGQ